MTLWSNLATSSWPERGQPIDPGDYILAERVATCLDEQQPGDPAALLLRGHALHQLHRFHEAETIARTLVTKREFVLDYALLGDTLMEQGRLAEAATAYQKMIDLKPFYQSYTRAAHLRWLTGDLNGAIELTRKAIEAASPRNPEAIAWAYTRLGAYELQRGDPGQAMRAVDAALSFQPDYAAALLMRGRALLTAESTERGCSRARAGRQPQSTPRVPVDAGRGAAAAGAGVRGSLGRTPTA